MRIVLLGDSITQGLGKKKVNFEDSLHRRLHSDDEVINLALTGTTIRYAMELKNKVIELRPDLVCILYGNVDAQIKPNRNGKIFKRLPHRFQGNNGSMIAPRPYYSHVWYKAMGQHFENFVRTVIRKLIYAIDGTEQWVSIDDFKKEYEDLVTFLSKKGIELCCCSTVYIDEKIFPDSPDAYKDYNSVIKCIASIYNAEYIDVYDTFVKLVNEKGWDAVYSCDHFHPNPVGYDAMAQQLADTINKKREMRD